MSKKNKNNSSSSNCSNGSNSAKQQNSHTPTDQAGESAAYQKQQLNQQDATNRKR